MATSPLDITLPTAVTPAPDIASTDGENYVSTVTTVSNHSLAGDISEISSRWDDIYSDLAGSGDPNDQSTWDFPLDQPDQWPGDVQNQLQGIANATYRAQAAVNAGATPVPSNPYGIG